MERRMESKKAKWGETVTQGGNGHAIRFFPASKQFYTRSCARCAGLLVNEWCMDLLDDTGLLNTEVLRCVQCGHRVDPVMLRNQTKSSVVSDYLQEVRHKDSVSTAMSGEAA